MKKIADLRFLVTGGAGFVGSHLIHALLKHGATVTIIDDLSTGSMDNIRPFLNNPRFRFVIDSITNEMVLDRLTSEADIVFHLAAAVGVKMIVERPVHTIETNVMGTERVLKTALRYQVKVILASTSEVYGKGSKIPFNEEDDVLLGPTCRSRWAYAASKMVDEFLGLAYHREYDLPVSIIRLFNTVGVRQTGTYGMVIPRFVQQALCGEPLTVFGDGQQSRCFCNVRDVVRAIIDLAMHPDAVGKVFNIGNTEEITIHDLALKIIEITNSSSSVKMMSYEDFYARGFEDMRRRKPDISSVQKMINWNPTISLEETLGEMRDYYLSQQK